MGKNDWSDSLKDMMDKVDDFMKSPETKQALKGMEEAMKRARYAMRSQMGHPYSRPGWMGGHPYAGGRRPQGGHPYAQNPTPVSPVGAGKTAGYPAKLEGAGIYCTPAKTTMQRVWALLLEITGGLLIFSGVTLALIGMLMQGAGGGDYLAVLLSVGLPLMIGGGLLAFPGARISSRLRRFRKYCSIIGQRESCSVQELAEHTGKENRFILTDLQKMIGRRMFLQGHLNRRGTLLLVTDAAYNQYLRSEQEACEQAQQRQEAEKAGETDHSEAKQIVAEGREYVSRFRALNDRIPGTMVSQRLDQIEKHTANILEHVEKNPHKVDRIHKLMGHYLPTVLKLVNTYADLESHVQDSENVRQVRQEIEQTLDTIAEAFSNLYDELFREEMLDIQSDISVLETMFAREGLMEDEFESEFEKDFGAKEAREEQPDQMN